MPDPTKMQEMMKDPSLAKLVDNPDFLKTTLEMLKSPMGKQQVEMIAKQTGMSGDTLIRILEWLVRDLRGARGLSSVADCSLANERRSPVQTIQYLTRSNER